MLLLLIAVTHLYLIQMANLNPRQGLNQNVTACLTVEERLAFDQLRKERGETASALGREAVLMLLTANGYNPQTAKSAS